MRIRQIVMAAAVVLLACGGYAVGWTCPGRINGGWAVSGDHFYSIGGTGAGGENSIWHITLDPKTHLPVSGCGEGKILDSGAQFGGTFGAVSGKWLYVVGGNPGGEGMPGVIRYTIDECGKLSDRTVLAKTPHPKLGQAGCCASGKWLVFAGGWQTREAFAAEVKANGDLGEWTKIRPLPTNSFCGNRMFRLGKRIFVSGSPLYAQPTDRVYSTEVDETGLPTKWRRWAELPEAAWNYAFFPLDEKTICFAVPETGAIYTAPVDTEGEIGAWTKNAATLPDSDGCIGYELAPLSRTRLLRFSGLKNEPRRWIDSQIIELK